MNLIMKATNTGYSIEQVRSTMTVGEFKEMLEDFNDDDKLFLSFDNGYTYGGFQYVCEEGSEE